jgi:hypothetical protein
MPESAMELTGGMLSLKGGSVVTMDNPGLPGRRDTRLNRPRTRQASGA